MWYLTLCCEAGVRRTRASLHLREYRRLGMELEWAILPSPTVLWVNNMGVLEAHILLLISELSQGPVFLVDDRRAIHNPTASSCGNKLGCLQHGLHTYYYFLLSLLQMTCHDFVVLLSHNTDIVSINFEIITSDGGVWLRLWQWSLQCSEHLICYPPKTLPPQERRPCETGPSFAEERVNNNNAQSSRFKLNSSQHSNLDFPQKWFCFYLG